MSAQLLLGKPCVETISTRIRDELGDRIGTLCTIGFNEERWIQYSNSLAKSANKYGFQCEQIFVDNDIAPKEFCSVIENTSKKPSVCGVIVEQPLPAKYADALNCVDVTKDVDCLNPLSVAKLYLGIEGFRPATPSAVLALLDYYEIDLQGKNVVIIGRGNAVGKPLALMALKRNATVTVCHTKTRDLATVCRNADILVSACGVAGLVTKEFVTSNSIVIDVGLSFVEGKTCGDVAPEVYEVCRAVSPVPGGVGPVTRAMLFENLLKALNQDK